MRVVPQTDPGAEYRQCREEIKAAIDRVLEQGQYVLGGEVSAFEQEFADYLGAGHAVGVGSGTDALELALRVSGVGPGDEVISVSHTAVATVAAIMRSGAQPVLVDVDPDHYTLAPETLPRALTPRTRAIVAVHLYGQTADMGAIGEFARAHGLRVVEDCAQAHGAAYRSGPDAPWQKAGTLGDIAAFSFYPTKNLGALGDGGCVVTRRPDWAAQARLLRQYGWRERGISDALGWNSRLDEIQAAVLRVKLAHLDCWNACRREIAKRYDEGLIGSACTPPARAPYSTHVFHQYVIRTRKRAQLIQYLADSGIATGLHYPKPVHLQPAYRALGNPGHLEVSEALSPQILSLPMFAALNSEGVQAVLAAIARSGIAP